MDNLKQKLQEQGLTDKEISVAVLAARGLSNAEIANNLNSAEADIKNALPAIYKKMGLRSRAQLIVWCLPHMDFNQ